MLRVRYASAKVRGRVCDIDVAEFSESELMVGGIIAWIGVKTRWAEVLRVSGLLHQGWYFATQDSHSRPEQHLTGSQRMFLITIDHHNKLRTGRNTAVAALKGLGCIVCQRLG
jgi:hypothetical protein